MKPKTKHLQVAADAKSYILRSQLPTDIYKAFVEDENEPYVSTLTFFITIIVRRLTCLLSVV